MNPKERNIEAIVRKIHRRLNVKDFRVCFSNDVPRCDYYGSKICKHRCNYAMREKFEEI